MGFGREEKSSAFVWRSDNVLSVGILEGVGGGVLWDGEVGGMGVVRGPRQRCAPRRPPVAGGEEGDLLAPGEPKPAHLGATLVRPKRTRKAVGGVAVEQVFALMLGFTTHGPIARASVAQGVKGAVGGLGAACAIERKRPPRCAGALGGYAKDVGVTDD